MSHISNPPGPSWLRDAIFYQIYPQSFFDANGDGIGDLEGIARKLDYIKSLGCNVIWINPCFDSPFGDAGYDIRDFYLVASRYGTNDDMQALFRAAHDRGMKVVLDLVAGHTSIEHPWFQESAQPAANRFTNRYVWTDNVWKGPGEGFDGIRGYSDRDGQYVTNFFHFQPALNFGFANPDPAQPWQLPVSHPDAVATRRELLDILLYWMGLGADGFRVDMAFSLVKNDPDGSANMALWQEIRREVELRFPEAALVSEWSVPNKAIPAGFHVDFMIHFGTPAYTELFRTELARDVFGMAPGKGHSYFDAEGRGDVARFLDIYLAQHGATRHLGYISVPTGNHDVSRLSCGRSPAELKVAFTLLFTLPGIPCIYYGDEIGMRHIDLPSKEGGYGRTGARTPMQWTDGRNAGFSEAEEERLYLPVDPAPGRPTVSAQHADTDSLLNHVRSLARLRLQLPALNSAGEITLLPADQKGYPLVFLRSYEGERCLVVLNPRSRPADVEVEWDFLPGVFSPQISEGVNIIDGGNRLRIQTEGFSYGIFSLQTAAATQTLCGHE